MGSDVNATGTAFLFPAILPSGKLLPASQLGQGQALTAPEAGAHRTADPQLSYYTAAHKRQWQGYFEEHEQFAHTYGQFRRLPVPGSLIHAVLCVTFNEANVGISQNDPANFSSHAWAAILAKREEATGGA